MTQHLVWEQHGQSYFAAQGNWEYMIINVDLGWRLCERRRGDSKWDTVTFCPTLKEAKATR